MISNAETVMLGRFFHGKNHQLWQITDVSFPLME